MRKSTPIQSGFIPNSNKKKLEENIKLVVNSSIEVKDKKRTSRKKSTSSI